jgi:hypothetical protein
MKGPVLDGFHTYKDHYAADLERTTAKVGRKQAIALCGSPSVYYTEAIKEDHQRADHRQALEHKKWMAQAMSHTADLLWIEAGRPYYRIYPDYAEVFSRTKLDIPVRCIGSPYRSYSIRFMAGHEPVFDKVAVQTLHVMLVRHDYVFASLPDVTESPIKEASDLSSLYVRLNGTIDDKDRESVIMLPISDGSDELLSDRLSGMAKRREGDHPAETYADLMVKLFSVALSVSFLATGGDKLIEPDLLNKDFPAYLAAVNRKDWTAAKAIGDKSHRQRNGQPGFTIGREETLLGRRTENRADEEVGEGRELAYQHQRKGHFHKFWTGPGRDQLVVKWVSQLTVRPDLPLPPTERVGARTLDSKGTEKQILGGA